MSQWSWSFKLDAWPVVYNLYTVTNVYHDHDLNNLVLIFDVDIDDIVMNLVSLNVFTNEVHQCSCVVYTLFMKKISAYVLCSLTVW